MIEILTYHESLLILTRLIAMADGVKSESEKDAVVRLRVHEKIPIESVTKLVNKLDSMVNDQEKFDSAIACLKKQDKSNQHRALAWMWETSAISGSGSSEVIDDLSGQKPTWDASKNNVSPEEKYWIELALKELDITEQEMEGEFSQLPTIKKII